MADYAFRKKETLTNHDRDYRHAEEVKVRYPPELLRQVQRQEGQQRVLGGLDPVCFLRLGLLVMVLAAHFDAQRVGLLRNAVALRKKMCRKAQY